MEYSAFVKKWIEELYSEIEFWENYIKTKGAYNGYDTKIFDEFNDKNREFVFDDMLPSDEEERFRFIDVGSGAFSRCGRRTKKCNLEITCVDPLANLYEIMKKKYGINNGNVITRGFVELLNKQYEANSFDMVHMSNSLDHCFDPVYGIIQLINICKIGGKVILRHHENEAERGNYAGLHQWNLSLHNEEKSFVIWNREKRIDICKHLGGYGEFKLIPDIVEKGGTSWVYNQVEITKKKDIQIPQNDYQLVLMLQAYDAYAELIYELVEDHYGDIRERRRNRAIKKIREGLYDEKFLGKKEVRNVIWGYGKVGRAVAERMSMLKVDYLVIDRRNIEDETGNFKLLSEYIPQRTDKIFVTFIDEEKNHFKTHVDEIVELME